MASQIHGKIVLDKAKLGQVGLKLAQLVPKLGQVGVSNQALMYKFTSYGSHALPDRNLAQHSVSMAENPPKMEARGGNRTQVFRPFFVLEDLLAPRGLNRGPRELHE